jgi:hypothetical protein
LKFENPSSGSKVMFFYIGSKFFGPKSIFFCKLGQISDVTLILKDGIGQKIDLLTKNL